ncbi:zinc-binding dehydrogenase [Sphingobium chungangianum]
MALFARHAGARHVVVSERSPERRALAQQVGATAVIDPQAQDVAAAFAQATGENAPGSSSNASAFPASSTRRCSSPPSARRSSSRAWCCTTKRSPPSSPSARN